MINKICTVLLVFFLALTTNNLFAQGRYDKGDALIGVGFGLGYYYAGGSPLLLNAEFALNDKISVGPYLGYTNYTYRYAGYKFRYSFIDIGARGSYHFSEAVGVTDDKLDLYAGAFLGFIAANYTGDDLPGYKDPYSGGVRLGIHGGARYFFAEKIAGYAELGWGIAPLSLGVTFKL